MTSLIIQGNFKGIGFDVMGLDPLRDNNLNRHKALFKDTDIVNIENLTHLEQCGMNYFGLVVGSLTPLFTINLKHSA